MGKVEPNPSNPLEYAKIYRLAQARTRKPVKFGTVSAQVMAQFLDVHTDVYDQDDKRQLIWDMATAINQELREVVAAGCKVCRSRSRRSTSWRRTTPSRRSGSTS